MGLATALHSPKSNRTAALREIHLGGPITTLRASDEEGMLRAAFRDAHGARLHGFAILITLGDHVLAADLAADALAAGTRHAAALRHPERAAAWMRRQVLRKVPRRSGSGKTPSDQERRAALAGVGVDAATYDVLARLSVQQRAALIAGLVEGLSPLDLELVLGINASALRRRLSEARRTFMARRAAMAHRSVAPDRSSLEARIQRIADQALGRRPQ
jgi:DNA-directed RNA polymerase specialized sigma24 family protein